MKKAVNVIKYALLAAAFLFQMEIGEPPLPQILLYSAILLGFIGIDTKTK